MRSAGRLVLLASLALVASGCQTIVLGAPKWPPCYLESDARYNEADELQRFYPATYAWIREMDALCVSWTRD